MLLYHFINKIDNIKKFQTMLNFFKYLLTLTLITLVSSELITTNLLWKPKNTSGLITYFRPEWAKNITIEIDDITNNINSVEGIIIPLSTTTRPYNNPNPNNNCHMNDPCDGHCIDEGYHRGHIMGLRNGGPQLSENIVAQWGTWQGNSGGAWYDFEEDINKKTFDLYGWNKTTQPVDLCMNDTQNNCIKEPNNKVDWKINLIYEEYCFGTECDNCELVRYEGFIFFGEKKYTFDFVNNGTEKIILKSEKIPNDEESSLIPWIFVFIVLSIWICVFFFYKKMKYTREIVLLENN